MGETPNNIFYAIRIPTNTRFNFRPLTCIFQPELPSRFLPAHCKMYRQACIPRR
jgi:hypothetical protein